MSNLEISTDWYTIMVLLLSSYICQGEEYKCIWPDNQEFVRMAARFGATIVPFGAVGEDDVAQVCFCFLISNKYPVQ